MIPERLQLTGFLSYNQTVEIPFDSLDLACISGQNGAGKSSILDGITWVLFGKARGSDEDLINSHCDTAEVILDFRYEHDHYRVQRSKTRKKSSILEFYIQDANGTWHPLTESSLRATEEKIQRILRLDYETFINASFFLQGKADQFAQQSPGDRKKILSSVLGLEVWEAYRNHTAKIIREREQTSANLNGQLKSYEEDIAREPELREQLSRLQNELQQVEELLKIKQEALDMAVQQESLLVQLKKALDEKADRLRSETRRLDSQQERLALLLAERDEHQKTLVNAPEIEKLYQAWLENRKQLEKWDALAETMHAIKEQMAIRQAAIERTRASLQAELIGLRQRQEEAKFQESSLPEIEANLTRLQAELSALMEQKKTRDELTEKIQALRLEISGQETAYQALIEDITALDERISRLGEAEEGLCPVCKKPLTVDEQQKMVVDLQSEKAGLEVRQRDLDGQIRTSRSQIEAMNRQLSTQADLDRQIQLLQQAITREEERLAHIQDSISSFQKDYFPHLAEIELKLANEDFEPDAQAELQKLAAEAEAVGYDEPTHFRVRQAEQEGRKSEELLRSIEKARATLGPLEREISTLETSIAAEEEAFKILQADRQKAEQEFQQAAARLPDKAALDREVTALKVQVNRKRTEVGGAENNIKTLATIRERRKLIAAQRDEILGQITRLKELQRAFSKDGVPALLIEQALPEIESQANELLERLSNGTMSLKFETQADYKDSKRTDKKETLEIKISDSSGAYREYEMYSGGEAFRVNFAIRLALSQVLAHRAGARLQTLVIDEGFGSQDMEGRQRLIEAINQVRGDFEKILVITHLEELKDAFPARIEVEKGATGSTVQVQVL